jgi:hypothetical protein
LPRFQPTYHGKNLFSPSLDPPGGAFAFHGDYEMVRAAKWWGLDWDAFDAKESDEQALLIATYRIEMRYQAVDAWANRPKKDTSGAANRGQTRRKRRR